MSPSAFFTMATMPVVGFLLGRKVDARYLIPVGLVAGAGASYWQAKLDLTASPLSIVLPRCLQMFGVGLLFLPLNNAAYLYLPREQTNNATGLFNMLRNEGGSLGIAIATTLVERRGQFHNLRLAEHVRPANPQVGPTLDRLASLRVLRGGVTSLVGHDQALALLTRTVRTQARLMAYLDVFWVFAVMSLLALPLVLLMKKSVAHGGPLAAH
jgi:DHA2 family multidrug resistance protein